MPKQTTVALCDENTVSASPPDIAHDCVGCCVWAQQCNPKPGPDRTLIFPGFVSVFQHPACNLSLSAPDALDEAVTLGQSVQSIVGLAHGTDETAESVDVVLARDGAARLVNLGDGDLDGSVVLSLDDAVGGRALAGDVAVCEG